MPFLYFLISFIASIAHGKMGLGEISPEQNLISDIKAIYRQLDRSGRPVRNISQPVEVKFGLGLLRMMVDEKDNSMSVSVWTKMQWTDEYLVWNPVEYMNVTEVNLDNKDIWIPDVELYNTAKTDRNERLPMVTVYYNGRISWVPHKIFFISCSMDVTLFPFDDQSCHMWFGSWVHRHTQVDLKFAFPAGIDLNTFQSDFKETSQWRVINTEAERKVLGGYPTLKITLNLQRNLAFSSYILTVPAVLLSFLTIVIFCLPCDAVEKSNLGLAVFGSLLLMLLILVESTPHSPYGLPLLGLYYCFNIMLVISSIFLSSLVARIKYGKHKRRLPRIIKIFCNKLGYVLCIMNNANDDLIRETQLSSTQVNGGVGNTSASYPKATNEKLANDCHAETMSLIHCYINHKMDQLNKKQERDVLDEDWKKLAMVLDRAFIVLHTICVICMVALLLPRYK